MFIRAALPSPSTSCAGTIDSAARDSAPARSGSSAARSDRAASRRARASAASRTSRARCRCRASTCRRRTARRGSRSRAGCRGAAERPLQDDDAGQARARLRRRTTGRRDQAEILRDERQVAERAARRVERLGARTRTPAAARGGLVPPGIAQYATKPRKWSMPRHVDELERAPEALGPPAVVRRAVRAPVVERVAPVLPGRRVAVGRRARDLAFAEQLGMRDVLGAAGGDVDRHVAEDADAAITCVLAQRAPLALEANLVGERTLAGEGGPVAAPERVPGDELLDVRRRSRGRVARRAARRSGERRRGVVRRAGRVGRARAEAPATTTALPPRASRRSGTPRRRGGRPAATSGGGGLHWRV